MYTDWNRKGAEGKYGAIGWYRIINPLSKMEGVNTIGRYDLGGKDRVEIAQKMRDMGKVWFVKYIDSFHAIYHLLAARDVTGAKLVVDIDDNVFEVHPHNYAYKDTSPDSEAYRAFQYLFTEADALTCSTEPLKEYMSAFNSKVYVVPNAIDPAIWEVPIKKNNGKKVKIGWVNGPTHEQDAPVLLPVLKEILKKYPQVEFYHIGWQSPVFDNVKGNQKMVFGTNGYKEFPKFIASLGMDIMVAPLIDDEFNRGKSNIKWMEGAMCEVPMVCSDVHPYSVSITHGEDGFLAKSTSDWIEYLSNLIESKELRQKVGKKAKENVLKRYQVKDVLPLYEEIIKDLNKPEPEVTVIITRRNGESDEESFNSLQKQSYKNLKYIRIKDMLNEGANVLRNRGWLKATSEYVLFSDNDLKWNTFAVKKLVKALEDNPDCDYSFGAYAWELNGKKKLACTEEWTPERLRDWQKGNIVSTMALVRREAFTGFDPDIKRLQDWDAWLTMLEHGKKGVHCGAITFTTSIKPGISFGNKETTYEEALEILKKKHNL